jgi:hypothetical protein
VTAAVAAGVVNWLILRHHVKRIEMAARTEAARASSPEAVGVAAPGGGARASGPMPAVIDESDTAGGHRIYFDPWAGERGGHTEPED